MSLAPFGFFVRPHAEQKKQQISQNPVNGHLFSWQPHDSLASFDVAMIRICAAVSGEVIAVIQAEDFEGTVKALKLVLAPRLDCSRFRQRLVSQDGLELCDNALVLPPANLQMILLQLRLPDTKQQEQLVAACNANEFDLVECLLSQPLDPNLKDELSDWMALHFAAWHGSLESACLLLEAHASVDGAANGPVGAGVAPIHLAAEKGNIEVVRLLLDAGANKDITANDGSTPLLLAARFGHTEVVHLLLTAGANKDQPTTDLGATPLLLAVQHSHVEVVRLLLEARANQDNRATELAGLRGPRLSPSRVAAVCGHLEIAHLLAEADANSCFCGSYHQTPRSKELGPGQIDELGQAALVEPSKVWAGGQPSAPWCKQSGYVRACPGSPNQFPQT